MNYVIPDDTVQFLIATSDSTGAAVDADATPEVDVYLFPDGGLQSPANGVLLTDNGADVGRIINEETGGYAVSIPVIAEFGFLPSRNYGVIARATVDTVQGKDGVEHFQVDPVRRYPRVVVYEDEIIPEPPVPIDRLILGHRKYGPGGNGIQIRFTDGGTGAGNFFGTGADFEFEYEVGVTTVGDLRDALYATEFRVVYGTDSAFISNLVSDNDTFELAGGADEESQYNMVTSGRTQNATANTVQLAAGENLLDDVPNGLTLTIMRGSGENQTRRIVDYDNATDTATVRPNYVITPGAGTTTYRVDRSVDLLLEGVNVTEWDGEPVSPLDENGYVPAVIFELSAPPGHGSEKAFNRTDTISFDFYVRAATVADSGTADWDTGLAGLTEADFTILHKRGIDTTFTTRADGDHVITETGGGWYKFVSSLAAYSDTDGSHLISVQYDPVALPANHSVREVWSESYQVTYPKVDVYFWLSTGVPSLVSGRMPADVTAISGDSGAADNLELQFDGTGLVGNTFPATQLQATTIDGIVDDILADTAAIDARLPSDPADASVVAGLIDALPTAAEIDTQLSGTHGAGAWGGGSMTEETIATEVLDTILAYEHAPGTNLGEMFERLEAMMTGELVVTEISPTELHYEWRLRGGGIAFQGTTDPTTGSRSESTL